MRLFLCVSFCFASAGKNERSSKLITWAEVTGETVSDRWLATRMAAMGRFQASGRFHLAGNFTREDALQELDTQIASNGNYLLLQRMGVMAHAVGRRLDGRRVPLAARR